MILEQPSSLNEREDSSDKEEQNRPIGIFSDYYEEGGRKSFADLESILERLDTPRDPNEKVNTEEAQEGIDRDLQKLDKLIETEREKESSLGRARAGLGLPHQEGPTLKELEHAREKLKEERHNIELAENFNDVLDSFGELSADDLEHIAEHGTTKKGETLYDKHGKEIHSELAKELAHLYKKGGRKVTWGNIHQFRKVVDRVLHDVASAIKGIFKGPGRRGGIQPKKSETKSSGGGEEVSLGA